MIHEGDCRLTDGEARRRSAIPHKIGVVWKRRGFGFWAAIANRCRRTNVFLDALSEMSRVRPAAAVPGSSPSMAGNETQGASEHARIVQSQPGPTVRENGRNSVRTIHLKSLALWQADGWAGCGALGVPPPFRSRMFSL